jgi:hypothetical protein
MAPKKCRLYLPNKAFPRLEPGDTFHSAIDGHLWVVLTEPDDQDRVLCVSFVTERPPRTDATVVCEPGEHPFFSRRTAVAYSFAQFYTIKRLTANFQGGSFTEKERCSKALLEKVYNGLIASEFTHNYILNALKQR